MVIILIIYRWQLCQLLLEEIVMIKVIKGTGASEITVKKAVTLISNLEPKASVNISDDLTCIDIPNGSVQVIWEDGSESVLTDISAE